MEVKYLSHAEIDKARWDNCLSHSFNGIIYGYSWYLDVVSPGWDALAAGDYEYIMPLTRKRNDGLTYLVTPSFTQQLGVFSIKKLSEETVDKFLSAIPTYFSHIDISLNTFNRLHTSEYKIFKKVSYELDLISAYDLTWENYSETLKQKVRKGQESGCELHHADSIEAVISLFKENEEKKFSDITEKDYRTLNDLINVCLSKGKAQIWHIIYQQKVCAGAIFVESNSKVIFLFSATNVIGTEIGAMPFLVDSFIKHNAQRNLTLDFGGFINPDLTEFYKSFGSNECIYLQIVKQAASSPLKVN